MIVPLVNINTFADTVSSEITGEALEGFNFAQQYAHASLGYYPEILGELFSRSSSLDN